MKRIALFALFTALCLGATQFPHGAVSQPADGQQVANLVGGPAQTSTGMIGIVIPLPDCGSYCYDPGAQQGCVDRSQGRGVRTPCMCTGGFWTCGSF